ncbi:fungal-specific transcription factor domain-containing protein [Aspergillus pseudocaelatus]|uniref:Fungal-specific transcription factor domain-containing protein n=1 Tax=Aspergillus pseudocaelatus TaxID=1825620 RepID=A0ABQ6W231_9EURO|nr:fungal-specific transcription factor domain-containing protein [Aspergillus pseudocaelatus]
MPKPSTSTPAPHELRACTECRKRKSKCSGTPPCSYCSRANKPCIFGRPSLRTPLTRKNMDQIERRCASLTALLHRLNPDVDIEDALKTTTISRSALQASDFEGVSPASVDEFEWSEASLGSPAERRVGLDGMASLPTGSTEAGYLGNSAGSSILRNVPGLIPEHSGLETHQRTQVSPEDLNQSPNLLLSAHLGTSAVLDGLVNAYFTYYNTSYPVLHESTFRQQYQARHKLHDRSSWYPIFYIVLAIGNWILGGTSGSRECQYYSAARSRMSMHMLESGTLLTVQAFLLIGNYLQKRDRPNTGYNFIGIAYRMALGLGLHREPPAGANTDSLFHERRRVIWWIVYCFDSGFGITTGRPVMASDNFIETCLPRNIDDSACTLTSTLPTPSDRPTTYSAIIAQARLASIGNNIYSNVISAPKENILELRVSRSFDYRLKAWRLSLPVYFTAQDVPDWFRGPRAVVGWKEQNLRMMLWWGSQRSCSLLSDVEEARNMCHYVAIETIQDITTFCLDYRDNIHVGLSWYATYFLFQATIVLSIHYLRPHQRLDMSPDSVNQELWALSISRARDCLSQLSQNNEAATRCLAVLERIRDQSERSQQSSLTPSRTRPNAIVQADHTQLQPVLPTQDANQTSFAIDPALQILFQDTAWNNDIFEGLQGFPITDEVEVFDYLAPNA